MSKIRIACTSDWHVCDRNLEACKHALDEVAQVVEANRPDYVALLGDLTHVRGKLDASSALLIKDTLRDLRAHGAQVVAIPGNHDLYRNGEGSNLDALLAHTGDDDRLVPDDEAMQLHSGPSCVELAEGVGAFFLPFYHKWQYDVEGTDDELVADLQHFIKGAQATLRSWGCTTLLCFTHMSIVGAEFDNEQMMKVGHDLALPASAFDGFDLVVSGHMHRPQTLRTGTGEIVYIGALQPFTFGDRWTQPRVVLVEAEAGGNVSWSEYPLTVKHALLRLKFDLEEYTKHWNGLSIPLAVEQFIDAHGHGQLDGARVRVEACLSSSQIALLDKDWQAGVVRKYALRELKILPRRTDNELIAAVEGIEKMTMAKLIDLWVGEQPMSSEERANVRKWAAHIEGEAGVQRNDSAFDHVPIRTTATNWKQWSEFDVVIDDWPSTVCIHGDNAVGKSNLAEAEAFALYGVNMKGTRLANCVKDGEKKCAVSHEFTSNGVTYRVIRSLTLRKDRLSASTTLKFLNVDEGMRELSVGTNKETQAMIDDLVGPIEHYRMRFAQQQDIAGLIEQSDEQRLDTFQRLLAFDLGARSEVARIEVRKAEGRKAEALAQANALLAMNDEAWRTMPAHVRLHVSQDEPEVATVERLLEEARTKTNEAHAVLDTYIERGERLALAASALAEERAGMEGELRGLPVPDLQAAHDRVASCERRLKERQDAMTRLLDDEPPPVEHAPDDEDLEGFAMTFGMATDELRDDMEAAEGRRGVLRGLEGTLIALRAERDTLAKQASGTEHDLPCHGMYSQEGTQLWEACPLTRDLLERGERIAKLDREIGLQGLAIENAEEDLALALEQVERQQEHVERTQRDLDSAKAMRSAYVVRGAWLRRCEDLTADVDAAARALVEAQDQRDAELKAYEEANAKRSQLSQRVLELRQDEANANEAKIDNERLIKVKASELDEYKDRARALEGALHSLERCEERRLQAEEHKEDAAFADKQIATLEAYRKACGRTGIPLIFLRTVVPEYERLVNAMLAPVDMRYELATTRTTTTGDERPSLDQHFVDANGRHPVKEASGFQRVVLGVALRLALTKLHGDLTGSGVSTVWQDEGWGAFSEQNIPLAAEMIANVTDVMGGRYVYITHVPELQETARARILVTKDTDGSQLDLVVG